MTTIYTNFYNGFKNWYGICR